MELYTVHCIVLNLISGNLVVCQLIFVIGCSLLVRLLDHLSVWFLIGLWTDSPVYNIFKNYL